MGSINHICISAGGTGGHIFPAIALAERMLKLGWKVNFITDKRGIYYLNYFSDKISIKIIRANQIKKFNIFSWVQFFYETLFSTLYWSVKWLKNRPNVVVGFGGYTSFPICTASLVSRVPLVLHEQNSVIGRVNRFFLNKSSCIALGFPIQRKDKDILQIEDKTFSDLATAIRHIEKKKTTLVYLGNPVRSEILSRKSAIYTPPGDWPIAIFVVGGSQSADIFSHVVPKSISSLPIDFRSRLRVFFQARDILKELVESELVRAGVRFEISEFFDDISDKIANSQLVISRAGASTLSEIAIIGRPSILVPLPSAKDDHQTKNAAIMQEAGASIVIDQKDFSPKILSKEIKSFLASPHLGITMSEGAIKFSKPQAGENFGLLLNQKFRSEE